MARYTEVECYNCRINLPAPQMNRYTINVKSGHSHYGATTLGRKNSTRVGRRVHYRRATVYACRNCPPPRSEGGFGWVFILLLIVAGAGALAYVAVPQLRRPAAAPQSSQKAGRLDAPSPAPSATDLAEPDRPSQIDIPTDDPGAPDREVPAEAAPPQPGESAAVQAAIIEALDGGRAVRWRDGDLRGYAVPSTQTDDAGTVCRAVSITMGSGGRETRGPDRLYCRSGQGWRQTD